MNKLQFPGSSETALKNSFNQNEQASDVIVSNSLVPRRYSRMGMVYGNIAGNQEIIEVKYYGLGENARFKIECRDSVSLPSTINNKYFFLNSGKDAQLYHVWYNLNGAGVDPDPLTGGSIGIEVTLRQDFEIASATARAINTLPEEFIATASSDDVFIIIAKSGVTSDPYDGNVTHKDIIRENLGKGKTVIADLILSYDGLGNLTDVNNLME